MDCANSCSEEKNDLSLPNSCSVNIQSSTSANPETLQNGASEIVKCCLCFIPTRSVLTLPACHHSFCLTCLERVHKSPLPESCPICLTESQFDDFEGPCNRYFCGMCSSKEATPVGRCIHCMAFICEECIMEHSHQTDCANHIILLASSFPMFHHEKHHNGWSNDVTGISFLDNSWSCGPDVEKNWQRDVAASEQSWSNSGGGGSAVEKGWSHGDEKMWLNSTSASAGVSERAWANGVGYSTSHSDQNDDDSLFHGSGGAGLSELATSSSIGAGSAGDTHSMYDNIHSSVSNGAGMQNSTNSSGVGSGGGEFGLNDLAAEMITGFGPRAENCVHHESERFTCFCKTCETAVCDICAKQEACMNHECIRLSGDAARHDCATLLLMRDRARRKTDELVLATERVDTAVERLKHGYRDDEQSVRNAFDFYLKALIDRRAEASNEIQTVYGERVERLTGARNAIMCNVQQLTEADKLICALVLLSGQKEVTKLFNPLRETLDKLLSYVPEIDGTGMGDEIAFIANQQAMQAAVQNTFGYLRHGTLRDAVGMNISRHPGLKKVYSAAELTSTPVCNDAMNGASLVSSHDPLHRKSCALDLKIRLPNKENVLVLGANASNVDFNQSDIPDAFRQANRFPMSCSAVGGPSASTSNSAAISSAMLYENRTTALRNGFSILSVESEDEMSKVIMPTICPSDFKRKKMEYHCKFGEFGSDTNQFYEPSGVAVTPENDILVADANNHRIQAFDRNGMYLRTIGQDRKGGEGDLVYPNRLTVNRNTGDIIVTERSPTHQVNVYNRDGGFLRKFGASILQHPRGITVDNMGRIIVVECKVMRVVIFSIVGSVLNRFVVDKHVNFPNGVAVNDREEIFISDNRRHGVVIFNYHGVFLRTVGGMGITNYPIGVGINIAGEVVIADNHNNFNVTVFTQEGVPIRALESRVKHAQCFDIALLDRGAIVLSSKDFRVYVYQYAPTTPSALPASALSGPPTSQGFCTASSTYPPSNL